MSKKIQKYLWWGVDIIARLRNNGHIARQYRHAISDELKSLLSDWRNEMKLYYTQAESVSAIRKFARENGLVFRKANYFLAGVQAYALFDKSSNERKSKLFTLKDVTGAMNFDGDFEHII